MMTSRTAARLVRLYPSDWRARYGQEFTAFLEQHPASLKTFANVLWTAGTMHMNAGMSHEPDQGFIVGSIWSAWMVAVIACLILTGMVDDSSLLVAMHQNSIFAASWNLVQAGCVLAVSAIVIAGLPLAFAVGLYALRERRQGVLVRLAIPLISAFALVAWMATVLVITGGHWAASPWAVAFSRPDWPSYTVRWITGLISAVLLVLGCITSATSVSQVLHDSLLPDLRIAFGRVNLRVNPLSFAATLAPWVAVGILLMLTGVFVWGCIANHLSGGVFRSLNGPLGLSGVASWILSTIILSFSAAICAQAVWRSRALDSSL